MDRHLTRKGALLVTQDIDRIATLIGGERQPDGSYVGGQYAVLGIPKKIALDFAWKCDVISDAIEKRAVANDKIHGVKAAAQDETGESVEPTGEQPSWDPNAIGDNVGGPHQMDGDEAGYMDGNFDQRENHQLRDKQQAGQVPNVDPPSRTAANSLAKLAKMINADNHETLRALSDRLKSVVAKLEASKAEGVEPIVSGARKQIAALDRLADQMITLDSTGEGDPELLLAADTVQSAVSEILPHLEMVVDTSTDQSSPTALLEHEQLLSDGTIVKLVQLAGKIIDDAMKSLKAGDKEASKRSAAKKAESDEDEDEDKAEDESDEDDDDDEDEDDDDEDEDDDDEDEDKGGKKASAKHGYDLFAA